jgi:hypothetical protein
LSFWHVCNFGHNQAHHDSESGSLEPHQPPGNQHRALVLADGDISFVDGGNVYMQLPLLIFSGRPPGWQYSHLRFLRLAEGLVAWCHPCQTVVVLMGNPFGFRVSPPRVSAGTPGIFKKLQSKVLVKDIRYTGCCFAGQSSRAVTTGY